MKLDSKSESAPKMSALVGKHISEAGYDPAQPSRIARPRKKDQAFDLPQGYDPEAKDPWANVQGSDEEVPSEVPSMGV
jgi:hypothetical protein